MKPITAITTLGTLAVILSGVTFAQQPQTPPSQPGPQPVKVIPKQPYDDTKARLALVTEDDLQLKANAATTEYQKQMADLKTEWTTADTAMKGWEEKVRKDNNWDESYVFDRTKYEWVQQPKPPAKPAEAKPAKPSIGK